MAAREEVSYPILRQHDVDYVLVVFGGLIGFSGDDINKFLWWAFLPLASLPISCSHQSIARMIRISEGIWPEEISESNYFNRGEYRVDDGATQTMKNSLMYKMTSV